MLDVVATRERLTQRYEQTRDASGVAAAARAQLPVETLREHQLGDPNTVRTRCGPCRGTFEDPRRHRQRGVWTHHVVGAGQPLQHSVDTRIAAFAEGADGGGPDTGVFFVLPGEPHEHVVGIATDRTEQVDQPSACCGLSLDRQTLEQGPHDHETVRPRPAAQGSMGVQSVDATQHELTDQWPVRPARRQPLAEAPAGVAPNEGNGMR